MKADLIISVAYIDGRTRLGESYFSPPLKIANITEDKKAKWLHLVMMSSSPGILDGDAFNIAIHVNELASLQLHTQSYQRLFNMKQGASHTMKVTVQKNAHFVYLPHPCVPHQSSIFTATNHIYLQDEATLSWGEIITCGRKGNGEIFSLSRYHNLTNIYLNDKLIIRENVLIDPIKTNPNLLGQLEQFTHQASLILIDANMNVADHKNRITALLEIEEGISFGITATIVNGLIVRILGNKGEQLFDCLKAIHALK